MTAHEHTGNDAETRSSVLRSIANSIEPAFPDAADLLLGIARELAARDAAVRADDCCDNPTRRRTQGAPMSADFHTTHTPKETDRG